MSGRPILTRGAAETLHAGLSFLASHQIEGRWRAFHLLPGVSDEWVSAYIAASLLEARVEGSLPLAHLAVQALVNRQRSDGRFGFNECAIGDGDSTLWALRLAEQMPGALSEPGRRAAIAALREHVRANGAVSTYAADEPIRTIIEAPPSVSLRGWCAGHPCVTAAAAAVPATRAAAIDYLVRHQSIDGGWGAYWWSDCDYTVALAAEALAGATLAGTVTTKSTVEDSLARAGEWGARRLRAGPVLNQRAPQGSPFATALALRACLAADMRPAWLDDRIGWLCQQIRPDGSWLPTAVLRVPAPDDLEPDRPGGTLWHAGGRREGALIVDTTAVFTTATVISAVARWRR